MQSNAKMHLIPDRALLAAVTHSQGLQPCCTFTLPACARTLWGPGQPLSQAPSLPSHDSLPSPSKGDLHFQPSWARQGARTCFLQEQERGSVTFLDKPGRGHASEETKATSRYRMDTSSENALTSQSHGSQLCTIRAWLNKCFTELLGALRLSPDPQQRSWN